MEISCEAGNQLVSITLVREKPVQVTAKFSLGLLCRLGTRSGPGQLALQVGFARISGPGALGSLLLEACNGNVQLDRMRLRTSQPRGKHFRLPLNMDGTEQPLTQRARKFAGRLHGRFGLQVALQDERLTTTDAKARLFERGGYRALEKGMVDSVSALLILEDWMEGQYGA